jgi:hypothetical protein
MSIFISGMTLTLDIRQATTGELFTTENILTFIYN